MEYYLAMKATKYNTYYNIDEMLKNVMLSERI